MGKHRKVRGDARHAKPTKTNRTIKRAAVIGGAAVTVPTAAFVFASPAGAATMNAWDATSIPEAGGDWCIDHSSDGLSVGGLQFQNPSWHDALAYLNSKGIDTSQWKQNLTQYMGRDNVPSKDQQVLAGEALLHLQGPGAWANGNFQGGSSMFDGGANPWGLSGTSIPNGILLPASCTNATPTPAPAPTPNPAPADGGTYAVVAGDTLYSIALAHGVTLEALIAANPQLVNPDQIEIGDMLDIPGVAPAPDPTPTPTPTPTPPPVDHPTWNHHQGWHWKHGHGWCKDPAPAPVPTPAPPVTPTDPAPSAAPATCDHIVVPGDTVSAVAASVGATLADVEAVNPSIVKAPRPGDYSLIFAGGHIHMPVGYCATGA